LPEWRKGASSGDIYVFFRIAMQIHPSSAEGSGQMKEYQSIATPALQFREIANDKAQEDWRVISVIPNKDLPIQDQGLKLADIIIIMERDKP
jgi:hypothetical protein